MRVLFTSLTGGALCANGLPQTLPLYTSAPASAELHICSHVVARESRVQLDLSDGATRWRRPDSRNDGDDIWRLFLHRKHNAHPHLRVFYCLC